MSVSSSGAQGDAYSQKPSISDDGRFVAFESDATNLVPGDSNGDRDVFVTDRETDEVTRVSVSTTDVEGDDLSFAPSISADGRYVAFQSFASNLVVGDNNDRSDVFVHDLQTGATRVVSVGQSGDVANDGSFEPSISANGRFVSFWSFATDLVLGTADDGSSDVFVRDLTSETTDLVSQSSAGVQGDAGSFESSISDGGRFVAFQSQARNLVPEDQNFVNDIYVYDRQNDQIQLASNGIGGESDGASNRPSISPDGTKVAFHSSATNLVAGDTNGVDDVFVFERTSEATERVSTSDSGAQATDHSEFASFSPDGRFLAFHSSADDLVAGDTNGQVDVFVRDLEDDTTEIVGDVAGNETSQNAVLSSGAAEVAFASDASNLVPGDTNAEPDVFLYERVLGNDWTPVGDNVNSDADSNVTVSDAADVDGTPYVAFAQNGAQQARVARWTGTAWEQVGGGPLNAEPGTDSFPSITAVGDIPYVTFVTPAGDVPGATPQVRVFRLDEADGDVWEEVGAPVNVDPADGVAIDASIATVGGDPYVTFAEEAAGGASSVWVKRWNGTAWVTVGTRLNSLPIEGRRPVIEEIDGEAYIGWLANGVPAGQPGQSGVRVSRFNGTNWQQVGDPIGLGQDFRIGLADVGGAPTILTVEPFLDHDAVTVDQWDGDSWERVGSPLATSTEYAQASIAAKSDRPIVSLVKYDNSALPETGPPVQVLSFGPSGWQQLGSRQQRSETSRVQQDSVVTTLDGDPFLAWSEFDPDDLSDWRINAAVYEGAEKVPPDTTITTTQEAFSVSAQFEFEANPPAGATFECKLDDGDFESCSSPFNSGVLDEGSHNFQVRATNADGTDPTPASRNFIVDRTPPAVNLVLDGGLRPSGYATAVVAGLNTADRPLSSGIRNTFCLVDPPTPPTSFSSFGSQPCPKTVTTPGVHTVWGVASDNAGNESEFVSRTFTILPTPDTTITRGPMEILYSIPKFVFNANITGSAFECRVDSRPFAPCASSPLFPHSPTGVGVGTHTFEVRAISPDGIVDPTPARYDFTLGERKVNGSCRFNFAFGGSGGKSCVVKQVVCPAGSVCVREVEVGVFEKDFGYISKGWAPFTGGSGFVDYAASCQSRRLPGLFSDAEVCPRRDQRTTLGTGKTLGINCARPSAGQDFAYPSNGPGPDDARYMKCSGSITIRPAESLEATASGTTIGVLGADPGTLRIQGVGGRTPMAASELGAKPTFKPMAREVTEAGVEEFKLKLVGKAKRKLKGNHRLKLKLEVSLTSAAGETSSRIQTVLLTSRCKPTKRDLC